MSGAPSYNPYVGQYVYKRGKPQVAGRIVYINGFVETMRHDGSIYRSTFRWVDVKWLDGKITKVSNAGLKDLQDLIDDHKRKINTHTNTMAKLCNL